MKNLIKKLSNTNISKTYMFILLGVSALMMTGYFSYAWFTVQGVQKYSVVTGNLTGTLAIGSNTANINGAGVIEYTPSTNNDTLTVTVTNSSDRTVKNSLYYYTLSDSSITIGYASDTLTVPSITGVSVDKGKNLTYKIKIAGAKGKTIRIGSSMGLTSSNLTLPSGANAFDQFSQTVSKTLLAGVGSNGSIDKTDPEQTFITGTDPNNYIWYSGKLWRAVSIDPSDNSVKLVTQWNISAIPYNASGNTAFQGSYMEQWLNDTSVDGFLGNLREPEKFIKTDSVWNATLTTATTKPEKTTMVTDTVGLLNIYEYTMSYKNATSSTGYLNNKLLWLTITPYNNSVGYYITPQGNSDYSNNKPSDPYGGIRPSINFKSTIKIIDGDGTNDNPYRLEGDDDNPTEKLLSTRYSGEYISFGTGENNLYRIVSHENGTGTKITSADSLKNNSDYLKTTFGDSILFSNSKTIAFLNNDYLTGSAYLTDDQVNMIEDSTTWYLGTVGSGKNYKLGKYQDIKGTDLTKITVDTKIGLLRMGELMAGKFNDYTMSDGYWLLTPYNSSNISLITQLGHWSYGPVSSSANANLHPAMNLKQNVVITGGDGTKNNPFTIKLG